ncbi:hypothetical protein GT350_17240, partial [Streptomyces sp. SID1034]|nr:hypothetical protein [Streptomyces sp. SID1034]
MTEQLMDHQSATTDAEPSILHGAPLAGPATPGVVARYEEWVRNAPQA